jgi:hypothetical protein
MSDDPASLANLRDIAMPPLPSFWPPAAGVTILAACILVFLAVYIAHLVRRARMNAYRQVAVAEIDRICGSPSEDGDAVAGVSAVLKRVALVAYPRAVVASLTGAQWASFLEGSNQARPGGGELKEFLGRVGDGALRLQPGDLSRLAEQAKVWARKHRPDSGSV